MGFVQDNAEKSIKNAITKLKNTSYTYEFDNNKKICVKIIVDKKSLFYLLGTELDFSDGLNGKGFQFNNPNANRTCGCGESFSL